MAVLSLSGCGPAAAVADDMPRYVSIDYCADQMLLQLVPHSQIAAVSHEAASDAYFAAPRARGIAHIRPQMEDLARIRPTVLVRSYGGGPMLSEGLSRMGVRVVQLGFPTTLPEVRADLRRVAGELGAAKEGQRLIDRLDAQLADARPNAPRGTALYVTPGDVTTGPGSLIAEVMAAAGYMPYRTAPGWGSLPLEALTQRPPDAVLTAFFDSPAYVQDRWTSSQHPVAQHVLRSAPRADVPGAALACGNWMVGDAVAALAAARADTKADGR